MDEVNDELLDTDMDLYGFTISVGRETENMGVNLGLEYAFGNGHTGGYGRDENGNVVDDETPCKKQMILVSLSTSYYF